MVGFKTTGGPELAAAFRALGENIRRPGLIHALTVAAEPMRADMARLARRGAEGPHLADHVGISVATKIGDAGVGGQWLGQVTDHEATVAVGPGKDFFYAVFLEYGAKGGKMPAFPFMRPAFDNHAGGALETIAAELWKLIEANAPSNPTGGR